jgi:hypothetical protein
LLRSSIDSLASKDGSLESFSLLIDSALVWTVDKDYANDALLLHKKANYQLENAHDKKSLSILLNGLSIVARCVINIHLPKALNIQKVC